MTVTYCTIAQVVSRLGLINQEDGTRFTDSDSPATNPSTTELEEFINDAEDEIDKITGHAFRTVTVTNETHDFDYPYYRGWQRAVVARLAHRNITTMVSGTDKIEIFDGSTFIDLVATKTEGTGFGENDFWVDKENGTVYIFSTWPVRGPGVIRVTYRYGDSTVPNDIRKACSLLASVPILQNDLYVRTFPANTDRFSLQSRAESYQKQTEKILARHIEWISG